MTTRRVRWQCPNGCPGVLGPTRPRRDNVCRYCLPCSAKAGKLIERTAPAMERQRSAKAGARKAKAAKNKTLAEEGERQRCSVYGIDLVAEALGATSIADEVV